MAKRTIRVVLLSTFIAGAVCSSPQPSQASHTPIDLCSLIECAWALEESCEDHQPLPAEDQSWCRARNGSLAYRAPGASCRRGWTPVDVEYGEVSYGPTGEPVLDAAYDKFARVTDDEVCYEVDPGFGTWGLGILATCPSNGPAPKEGDACGSNGKVHWMENGDWGWDYMCIENPDLGDGDGDGDGGGSPCP